jgi:hypothetical protein
MLVWAMMTLLLSAEPPVIVNAAASADSAAVEGVVVDAANGRPLPGTLVRVVGMARRT